MTTPPPITVDKNYTDNDILEIKTTSLNPDFDYFIMKDLVVKAPCKKCQKFYVTKSNSSLKTHIKNNRKAKEQEVDAGQCTLKRDGDVFIYNNNDV
ncbi:hypothetical protein LXL04_002689 [Taraxacum kok-saghyz]